MGLGRTVSGRHWTWWRDGMLLLKRRERRMHAFRANLKDKRGNEGGQVDEDVSLVQEGSKRGATMHHSSGARQEMRERGSE